MKKIYISILSIWIIMLCTLQGDLIYNKNHKSIFNGELVAKKVYEAYKNCFKNYPLFHKKDTKNVHYFKYMNLEDREHGFTPVEISWETFSEVFKKDVAHSTDYITRQYDIYDEKVFEEAGNTYIMSFYDRNHKRISVKYNKKFITQNYAYQIYAGCSKRNIGFSCKAYPYEEFENPENRDLSALYIEKDVKELFLKYKKQFNGQRIFKNNMGKMIKKINYSKQMIIYYFGKDEVVCDYLFRQCYINIPARELGYRGKA